MSHRVPPPRVSKRFVRRKLEYFQDIHLWPPRATVDPERWLANFLPDEQEYAVNLLNVFLFLNQYIVDQLFLATVHSISSWLVGATPSPSGEGARRWSQFLHDVVVTYVESEYPNPTKSGYTFARKARQVLGLLECQIRHPNQALDDIADNPGKPVLFVDDFVGSGNQMTTTWQREYRVRGNLRTSFRERAALHGGRFLYCPLVCTSHGHSQVSAACNGLVLLPVHELTEEDSLVGPSSALWPDLLKGDADSFLCQASKRAGIIDGYEYGWKGFHDLGLGLAFEHCVPDATLPLFFWEGNGWFPLVRRT